MKALVLVASSLALAMVPGCGGPKKVSEPRAEAEYRRLEKSARTAFGRGDLQYAGELYLRALREAQAGDDALRMGSAAFNLAACEVALGRDDRAREWLDEASAELVRAGEPTAGIHVLSARIELRAGAFDAADEAVARALDPAARAGPSEVREAWVVRGSTALEREELESARESLAVLEGLGESPSVLGFEADLELRSGRYSDAAQLFERQARSLSRASRPRAMSAALVRAGDAFELAGDRASAADRWLRAARARFAVAASAPRPGPQAIADLVRAAELCARITDSGALEAAPQLVPRLEHLVREISAERERFERFSGDPKD